MPGRTFLAALAVVASAGIVAVPAPAAEADNEAAATAGRALFLDFQCWQCHGYQGQGGAAPRIASMDYPFEAFERFLRFPNEMPAYPPDQLDDDGLRKIYAFVQSIPEPPQRNDIAALNPE